MASKLPSSWLTTNRESKQTSTSCALKSRIALSPASRASYSASLLEALKPNLKKCSTYIPSGVIITIFAPASKTLEAPSMNTLYGRTSTLQTISNSLCRENSATKSARTWTFTELLGLYHISKEPNRVPHLAIMPVKLDLFNKDCKGYSVRT